MASFIRAHPVRGYDSEQVLLETEVGIVRESSGIGIERTQKIVNLLLHFVFSGDVRNSQSDRAMPLGCHLLLPGAGWFSLTQRNTAMSGGTWVSPRKDSGRPTDYFPGANL